MNMAVLGTFVVPETYHRGRKEVLMLETWKPYSYLRVLHGSYLWRRLEN